MARLNHIRTIILLIIFCVLGAYVLWPPGAASNLDGENESGQALLPVNLDSMEKLAVQYKMQRPGLVLRKEDQTWLLDQPKQGKANPDHVRQLLGIFQYGYVEAVGHTKQDLAAYGLDKPEIVLTLTGSLKGQLSRARVLFGKDSPSKAVCYCLVEGDPRIFTVGVLYKRELEKSPEYFLRKSE